MSETPYMSCLRVWVAMAWADGVIAPAEAEALRRLIALAPIQEPEREVARGWLSQPVELDLEYVRTLGNEARRGVYQAAARMAKVDMTMDPQERALLDRLRDALGIDPAVAADIESKAAG
jgi:uncharacterized membrane protein YebE (DUF533 family)